MARGDSVAPDCGPRGGKPAVGEDEFIAFAAGVLKVAPETLSAGTEYGSIPEWDSVAHLRLVMEAEKRFGVYYPLERIPSLRKLGDFIAGKPTD